MRLGFLAVSLMALLSFESRAEQGTPATWASSWLPQTSWHPAAAEGSPDAAELMRRGRFAEALQRLSAAAPPQASPEHLRHLLSVRLLVSRQFSFPGAGIWLTGDVLTLQPEVLFLLEPSFDTNISTLFAQLPESSRGRISPDLRFERAFTRLLNMRSVMRAQRIFSDLPFSSSNRLRVDILGMAPAPTSPGLDGWDALLRASLEGELFWAQGAIPDALRTLLAGEQLALSSGALCAAGELAMLQGDVRAAPFGPVETQGLDPYSSGFTMGLLRMHFLPPHLQALPAELLVSARGDYGRARGHFNRGRCPRTEGLLALRGAYLSWRGREPAALQKYLRAAELAGREGLEREAALARIAASVLDGDGGRLSKTIALAAQNADPGLVLAAAHLVRVRAGERWLIQRDWQGALQLVDAMGKAAEEIGMKQTAADMFQLEGEMLLELGRSDVAVSLLRKIVALRSEHLQAVQDAASRLAGADALPKSFAQTMNSERFSVFDAQAQLMLTYGRMAVDEGNPRWLRLFKEARAELEPHLKVAKEQGFTAEHDFSGIEVALAIREALGASPGSEERTAGFERARSIARGMGDPLALIQVDTVEGDDVPEARARAREGLRAAAPVARVAAALRAMHQPPTMQDALEVARAIAALDRHLDLVERAGAEELLASWAEELRPLVREPGVVPELENVVSYLESLLFQREGRLPEARALLERLLAPARGLEPGLRVQATELLIEVLAGQGEAERSLLLHESFQVEQAGLQSLRNGNGSEETRAFAERLALERLAVMGSLTSAEQERLERLRARTGPFLPGFPPPTLASLRRGLQSLGKTRVFIGLRPLRHAIVLWTCSEREGLKVQLLSAPLRPTVRMADELLQLLSHQLDGWEPLAAELQARLLAPVGRLPEGVTLVVMAPGALGRIPFESLGGTHPIIYTDRITELPGRKPTKARGGSTLVVGVNGEQLLFAEDEAQAVASALHTRAILGDEATEESITSSLASARYVHIATHGSLDTDNPFRSFVELAGGRRLEAWKLLQRTTRAELVVLSACETGLGLDATRESETASLGATAHSAGARWVISSRWKVDDQATAEMFVKFYEELPRQGIAEALRRARSIQAGWHPRYRDAFALSVRSVSALDSP
jgi:hypothetical protein